MKVSDLYDQWQAAIADKEAKYNIRCAYPFGSRNTNEYKQAERTWYAAVDIACNLEDNIIALIEDKVYVLPNGDYLLVVESPLGDNTKYLETRVRYNDNL